MKELVLNQTGGFPFTTNILNQIQQAYNIFNAFGNIAGNFSIISGCVVTGTSVSEGVVFINGELYPFKGGNISVKVRITEKVSNREFENGQTKGVIIDKIVEFGNASINAFDWSNFTRFSLPSLFNRIEKLESRLDKTVPIGLVAVWGKLAKDIPEGWEVFEPAKGRTPIGRDEAYDASLDEGNYKLNELGYKGGKREHPLSIEEMPDHKHKQGSESFYNLFGGGELKRKAEGTPNGPYEMYTEQNTSSVGANKPHTNMQPYVVVDYMIFKGFN